MLRPSTRVAGASAVAMGWSDDTASVHISSHRGRLGLSCLTWSVAGVSDGFLQREWNVVSGSKSCSEAPDVVAAAAANRIVMSTAADCERRSFKRASTSPRLARNFVTDIFEGNGAAPTVVEAFQLAVSELVSNVVEHGAGEFVDVEIDVNDPKCWEMIVVGILPTEQTRLPMTHLWQVAGPFESSGRGLGIVRQLMDEVSTSQSGSSLAIRCSLNKVAASTDGA
jgi:anti-sigma regulatory factor (Ser/Thr protein kinase)